MTPRKKVYVKPGEKVRVIGNYSEIMMHFGLAGKPIEIELIENTLGYSAAQTQIVCYSAQIYVEGQRFSAPVLAKEAGFYEDEDGFYAYEELGPGDNDPKKVIADIEAQLAAAFSGTEVMVISDLGLNF